MTNICNGNENILIKSDKADTINQIHDHVEWLCLATDNDESIHPGLIQSLHMIRQAVKSLKCENNLQIHTQKV